MTPDPNPVTWTPVPCMLCGADDPRPRVVDTVRAGSAVYRFNVVQCRACGFEYVTPRGSGAVFGNLAGGAARRDAAVANAPFYRTGVARLRAAGLPDGGRILDLGCARGDFLAFAAERGFAVTGVDLNPALADAARARGFAVVTGDLRAVASEVGRGFDAVTLWDVIEHVDDPVAVLAACRDVVRPGGWSSSTPATPGSRSRRPAGCTAFGPARVPISSPTSTCRTSARARRRRRCTGRGWRRKRCSSRARCTTARRGSGWPCAPSTRSAWHRPRWGAAADQRDGRHRPAGRLTGRRAPPAAGPCTSSSTAG